MSRRKSTTLAPVALAFALGVPAANAQTMYWVDYGTDTIRRASLDGSNVEDLLSTGETPIGIALDLAAGKMYWTDADNNGSNSKIQRANLHGSDIEDLVMTGSDYPRGIALDLAARKMYWTGYNKVRRANLDGSAIEDLVTTGVERGRGIALDLIAGKIYWTDNYYGAPKIQRANLDGSNVETLITWPQGSGGIPWGIAVDPVASKMYWANWLTGEIQRADLDGSNVEGLVGAASPDGITLDLDAGKMYWTQGQGMGSTDVRRANLDGSNVEDLVAVGIFPAGIALAIDCNDNGIRDNQDIVSGFSEDCNENSIPDECEPNEDCNENDVQDICDIAAGTSGDCNANNVPDDCDIVSGVSQDLNDNGYPDECESACCIGEDCTSTVEAACALSGGIWVAETACPPANARNPCEVGACCTCLAVCDPLIPSACHDSGGVWTGGSCDPNPCWGIPDNDHCADAVVVTSVHQAPVLIDFNNVCATDDGPNSVGCWGGSEDLHLDIWYQYIVEGEGTLTVTTCERADYDLMIVVYDGSSGCPVTSDDEITCGDDTCGISAGPAEVSLDVVPGQQLLIRLGGWYDAVNGTGDPRGYGAVEFRLSGAIPTLSEWALVAMTLLVLTAGTLVLIHRRPAAA